MDSTLTPFSEDVPTLVMWACSGEWISSCKREQVTVCMRSLQVGYKESLANHQMQKNLVLHTGRNPSGKESKKYGGDIVKLFLGFKTCFPKLVSTYTPIQWIASSMKILKTTTALNNLLDEKIKLLTISGFEGTSGLSLCS